ncbi:MAG TPA: twin-arginine translocase TatA/TatE family subunit [Nitrososphaerales archaeon]|nr:twin-arginine translocase TatA/TatE family subunit [Nitrososphaerales archaeon]
MAWDDPVVWVLIIGVVVFLFGANKIPQFARGLGQARREFDMASKGITSELANGSASANVTQFSQAASEDPLVVAAQNEGIDTMGKTRQQIATELSWKLNKK